MVKSSLFVNLLDSPYSRRGSYITFCNNNNGEDLYGKCTLWLCNCRNTGSMMSLDQSNGFRSIKLELIKNGREVPYVISTTPYEVVIESRYGSVRFCIGERKLVMCKGTDGLTLRITPQAGFSMMSNLTNMLDGTWLVGFRPTKLLLVPFEGELSGKQGSVEIAPDAKGNIRLAFEEFSLDPVRREAGKYPSYDECVASVKADFDGFCERIAPKLPAKFEEKRLQSLWQTWNMIVDPDGESDYKRPMVKMIHSIFEAAFAWQQPMQGVWLSKDIELAWQVFISVFDHQDKNGRIVDALGFRANPSEALKPPIQGTALLWLMDNRDLSKIPVESKAWLWERMEKWTNYFRNFRDFDKDGILEFLSPIETGWEDAPYFNVGFPNASPDLNAYLALQMEALARLGREIGKPEDLCALWENRSKELVSKIVEKFWDGQRWFAFNAQTGQRSDSSTISLYTVLVLGKRLPQKIIDKSIEFIYSQDGFDTPYGLASEALTSDYFFHGFTRGSIISPAEFIMSLAFEACERPDLAKDVANKYCAILRDNGFFHIHNALTGKEDRSLTAFGERGLFWSAWASSCYFYFADRYGE